MNSRTSPTSPSSSLLVCRVITGLFPWVSLGLWDGHDAVRRTRTPSGDRHSSRNALVAVSASPALKARFMARFLQASKGPVRATISCGPLSCRKYMSNRGTCRSNAIPPLLAVRQNANIKRTCVLKYSVDGAGDDAPTPALGSALEREIRWGTMTSLSSAFAPLSALAFPAHAGSAAGLRSVCSQRSWSPTGLVYARSRSPPGHPSLSAPVFPGGTHVQK